MADGSTLEALFHKLKVLEDVLLGCEELLSDVRFQSNSDWVRQRDELAEIIEERLVEQDAGSWLEKFEAAGVPAGPIYTIPQVFEDPQVLSREMLIEMDHPRAGRVKNIGSPLRLSATPPRIRHAAPTLGQHTVEILKQLDLDDEEIARLRAAEAIE